MTGDPDKEYRTNQPPPTTRVWKRSKGDTVCLSTSQKTLNWNDWPKTTQKLIHHHKTQDWEPRGRAVLLGSLTLLLSTWVPFPNKISCFISICVSSDNSFLSVRQEPSFGPWKGSPFLQQMVTLVGTLLLWDWHPDHSGYSGANLPANRPDPVAATGTLLSLVSSWRGQLARVPRPVRNKRLYWPLSPSLSLSSP